MRRIIVFTLLALTLGSGAALADRDHHRRGESRFDARGGVTIRNPRDPVWHQRDRRVERDRRVVVRRPIYVSNGYYQFHNGHRYRYSRPVIRQRHFDVRVRPQIIVENYQPMTGYIWVAGQWSWNGYEWSWVSGHYEADPSYSDYYDDGVRY
ncbi:MAG TPA: hypothetical protein VNO30_17685 [Kofleriaceae bacterium]|nr:hypothetical protein [Kofleriaceae bacterium]